MINTSIEYKQAMQENNCCIAKATIVLKDGTTIAVDSSRIMQGGTTIDDGTSSTSSFDIGSAIINKLTLQLNNTDDVFSDYDFTDAVITIWVGKQLSDRIEWLKKGVFNAEDPKANTSILTIEALDNMEKFDRDYDGNMTFPTTLQAVVQYCCDKCGVLSNAGQFDFYNYPIAENPFDPDQDYTYREILHYAAQVSGCYARCNVDGRLELKWYDRTIFETNQVDGGYFDAGAPAYASGDNLDGGNFTDYASGDSVDGGDFANASWNQYHHITAISSLEVSTDDVVITGIQVKAMDQKQDNKTLEGETILFGEKGYILSISKNPLIPYGKASGVVNHLGQKIVGMRFRKMSASCLGDPSIEAGDAAFVSDRKGNTYQCYITNLTYTAGSYERISTDAETPSRNSSRRYSEITKAIIDAKKDTDIKLSKYDEYVSQMNQLAMNAMGYYQTIVGQDDGSRVTYMHDKPNLSDSRMIYKISMDGFFMSKDGGKTYSHGVDKDGNAVMNIVAAIGIVADWINTRGLKAQDNDGNVTFEVDANTGKVNIKANTFSLQGQSIGAIAGDVAEGVAEDIASDKVNNAMNGLNQETIFNKLTNNGTIQGLYMKDGQLYVNASYILSGLLTLGGANNINGILRVLDAGGNESCLFDKDGAQITGEVTIKKEAKHFVNKPQSNLVSRFGEVTVPYFDQSTRDCFEIYNDSYEESKLVFIPKWTGGSLTSAVLSNSGIEVGGNGGSITLKKGTSHIGVHNDAGDMAAFFLSASDGSMSMTGGRAGTNIYTIFNAEYGGGPGNADVLIQGAFRATGGKTRVVKTDHYETVTLNAVESTGCFFQDYGGGIISDEGICYVFFEPIFRETVNLEYGYFVQISKTSSLGIEYIEKNEDYFKVFGEPGATFDWSVTAKQRGYENEYLERYKTPEKEVYVDDSIFQHSEIIESLAEQYLKSYEKEIEFYDD